MNFFKFCIQNLVILTFILKINGVFSGEVDNYLSWEKEIPDDYILFNKYLNNRINKILKSVNSFNGFENDDFFDAYKYGKCENVSMEIIRTLGTNSLGFAALSTDFSLWAENDPEVNSYPVNTTTNDEMRLISLYGPKPSFLESFFLSIDRVVNVGGIYLGTDKLSHFTGSGYLYYKNYLKKRNKGKGQINAVKYAIKKGYLMEGGIIGIKSTGVFSYADQEANFQGLLMSIDMCEGNNPYLSKINDKWVLNKEVDFRDYVNPYWDESYNVSGYTPSRVNKMLTMIKRNGYCDMQRSSWVDSQRENYKAFIINQRSIQDQRENGLTYSVDFIKELENTDPDAQKMLKKSKILPRENYQLEQLCQLL